MVFWKWSYLAVVYMYLLYIFSAKHPHLAVIIFYPPLRYNFVAIYAGKLTEKSHFLKFKSMRIR